MDEYSFDKEDFAEPFYMLIYSAAYNLYNSGVNVIDNFSIDSYLSNFKEQYKVFNDNNGLDYISDIVDLYQKDNFPYFYSRLKKFSCLRYWEKRGYDTRNVYDSTVTDLSAQEKEMYKLDNMSVDDMIDIVEGDLVDEPKMKFSTNTSHIGQLAGKNLMHLKNSFKEVPDYGLPLQSPMMSTIARGCRLKKLYLRSSNSGGGKAIPNDTIIPTPSGYRKVGDIKVGDYLFDRRGNPTKVLAVYPQPKKKRVYEITFSDGRKAECCEDHLWSCKQCYSKNDYLQTYSTKFLYNKIKNENITFEIPNNAAVEYETKEYALPPYLVGQLLMIKPLSTKIPEEYLMGDIQQRKSLLQGLLTNGYIENDIPDTLKKDIQTLCYSLGVCFLENDDCYFISSANYIGIKNIEATSVYKDMTCFTVDNDESLFLMNDYIVTHNTRTGIADMANISVPYKYNLKTKQWDYTGFSEPVLMISTELEIPEIQTILIAYVSGVNEGNIRDGTYKQGEEERVDQAIEYIESSPFYIEFIPDFGINDIEQLIRKYKREQSVYHFFFDYVHMSNKLIVEIATMSQGMKLREDQILFLFIDTLKNLCNKLGIFILSSTQLNGTYKDSAEKDETMLRGAKNMADRIDLGEISLAPSPMEQKMLKEIIKNKINCPEINLIRHVYKLRGNRWSKIKICQHVDLGTGRTEDIFVLNKDNVLIDIPVVDLQSVNVEDAKKVEDIIQDNSEDANNMPEDLEATCIIAPNDNQEQPSSKNKLIF